MSDTQRVVEIIRAINDCWLGGRYEDLDRYFHESMVVAMPGFEKRVEGREAIVASYREFGESAAVRRFETGTPYVDVVGATAVSTTRFEIDYELAGEEYVESGTDLLVFQEAGGEWRVVWRTVITG
jgi:hypothetical protein